MFSKEMDKINNLAIQKKEMIFTKEPVDYLKFYLLAFLAGIYISLAMYLALNIGAALNIVNSSVTKLIMGLSFSVGLILVVFAGSELFTGNVMIMSIGLYNRKIKFLHLAIVLLCSYIINWNGAYFISTLIYRGGLLSEQVKSYLLTIAEVKVQLPIQNLIIAGFLCNLFVCLAIWLCQRVIDESTKIILIIVCVFAFVTLSFEHSVANMFCLLLANMVDSNRITFINEVYNLTYVTLGNILGGIFIGFGYAFLSDPKVLR
jgi:nitrite transporter NirC